VSVELPCKVQHAPKVPVARHADAQGGHSRQQGALCSVHIHYCCYLQMLPWAGAELSLQPAVSSEHMHTCTCTRIGAIAAPTELTRLSAQAPPAQMSAATASPVRRPETPLPLHTARSVRQCKPFPHCSQLESYEAGGAGAVGAHVATSMCFTAALSG
jgi:hypothetical protein